jgi:predicted metalloendopeptidase
VERLLKLTKNENDPGVYRYVMKPEMYSTLSQAKVIREAALRSDVLAKSGLEAATTKEDVLRALGRMSVMGVTPAVWLEPFFMDGKVCLYAQKTRAAYNAELAKENDGTLFGESKASLQIVKDMMAEKYSLYLRAKIIADQMVPQGVKEDYLKYCEELRTVFAQRIKDNVWMSEGSKRNALEKLDAMVFNVGYPDKWISEGLPDFSNTKSLIEDIYSFRKTRVNIMKAIVGKSRQETAFTVILMDRINPLSTENAAYHRHLNAFTIFPYYLLPPFYDPTQSLAINYAHLSIIGHEITHGFDIKGSQYDKHGDYIEGGILTSEADKAEFNRRTEQLVKCYESYDILPDELPGVKAEGKITLAENIADLGETVREL